MLNKLAEYFGPGVAKPEVLAMDVKVAPPGGAFAYYIPPSLDGKRRGSFNIDLEHVAAWKKFDAMALTLHEGNPGHNLQVILMSVKSCIYKCAKIWASFLSDDHYSKNTCDSPLFISPFEGK